MKTGGKVVRRFHRLLWKLLISRLIIFRHGEGNSLKMQVESVENGLMLVLTQ